MKKKAAIALALAATCLAGAAHASVTLSNTTTGSISSFGGGGSTTYGQVFTAPVTGVLTSFTLSLNGAVGGLYGGVGTWNGGSSFNTGYGSPLNLFHSPDVASSGPGSFTFTPNVAVNAGDNYVAYLSVIGVPGAFGAVSMPTGASGNGINYFVWNNGSSSPDGNASWNYFSNFGSATFSATFDERQGGAVPEPATWAMMLVGFGVVGAAMRARKANVRFAF